jgi:hypothetical protein
LDRICPACAIAGARWKTRIAIIGLDHDHVWRLLHDIAGEPQADLVAIAEPNPALTSKAKSQVSAGVQFYSD